jgi:phytoene synthase
VGKALQDAITRYNLPQEHFLEIIGGMEMDLDYNAYRTFEELSLYCYRAASAVGLIAAEIFGYEDRRTLKYAHDLGMAFQLTNILRDIGEDAQRGRVYIPEEDMMRFNVSRDDILHGRLNDNMRALLRFQAERAGRYYQQALSHLPDADRYRQRSGLIMAAVYQSILKAIADADYQVFEQRVNLSPPRKMWIAWQTARREKRQHLERTV